DLGVYFAVGAFQVGVRNQGWSAVTGADDVDHVEVVALDDPVEMDIQHVEPRRCAPVPEQPRLDVLALELTLQQRVVQQVDLPDRQIFRPPPVRVHCLQLGRRERTCCG